MKKSYRSSILIVLAVLFSPGTGDVLGAPKFPEKPVTVVVHAGPGSGADSLARFMQGVFEKYKFLPEPMVVENKQGGGSAIAMAYLATKKKDPYFLMTVGPPFITTPLQGLSPLSYRDFTPICNLSMDQFVLVVNANSKYKSIKEIVADAKANPKKVTLGMAQVGGTSSIFAHFLEKTQGIRVSQVPFSGGGEAVAAILGGHVDMLLPNPSEVMGMVKTDKLRVLGVLTEERIPALPNIPTLKEQGFDITNIEINRGLVAPPGIPEDACKILQEALFKFSQTEEYSKFHRDNLISKKWMDGPTFGKWLTEQNDFYAVVLQEIGLVKKK